MRPRFATLVLLIACGGAGRAPDAPTDPNAGTTKAQGNGGGEGLARASGDSVQDPCIGDLETAKATSAAAPRAGVLGHLDAARCYKRNGRIRQALIQARDALADALRTPDDQLKVAAEREVQDLLPRLSHLKLAVEGGTVEGLVIDGKAIGPAELRELRFTVDPGSHRLQVRGQTPAGRSLYFDRRIEIAEGAETTVQIDLR